MRIQQLQICPLSVCHITQLTVQVVEVLPVIIGSGGTSKSSEGKPPTMATDLANSNVKWKQLTFYLRQGEQNEQ